MSESPDQTLLVEISWAPVRVGKNKQIVNFETEHDLKLLVHRNRNTSRSNYVT